MELVTTSWHAFSSLLVLLLGCLLCMKLNRWLQISQRMIVLLYFWHSLFCLIYIYLAVNFGADALGYFVLGDENLPSFAPGTVAIYWLVSFLLLFDLSFLGVSLCFNVIGAMGLMLFYASLNSVTRFSGQKLKLIVLMIAFLPSVSFWSSAIGKDAISFMAIGLMLWATLNRKKQVRILCFSIFIMFLIRPHIAMVMLGSLAASSLFQRSIPMFQRILLGLCGFVASFAVMPLLLESLGFGLDFDASHLVTYIETRQGHNMDGGGGIDISSMSFGEKLFTYLIRPLPFEAAGFTQLVASLDNMFLLFLLVLGFLGILKLNFYQGRENRVFMWVFLISTWIILALTTANLGIAVRQKWMFLPVLIYLIISKLALNESLLNKRKHG